MFRGLKLIIVYSVVLAFLGNGIVLPPVNAQVHLPKIGQKVGLSQPVNPAILRGMKVYADQPFKFEFVLTDSSRLQIDSPTRGYSEAVSTSRDKQTQNEEITRLVKYFLAGLTIPEGDLWVNLSPYEKNRIVPESFGLTGMGRDVLAQDYLLKQLTANLMHPDSEIGKEFWKRIYEEARKQGISHLPVNALNKVWIVPDKAEVYEGPVKNGQATAYITKATLKVMLEEDYIAASQSQAGDIAKLCPQAGCQARSVLNVKATEGVNVSTIKIKQVIASVILPVIEKEVNEGANFAALRQVYNSLILATWYKEKIKKSLIAKQYVNQKKVQGLGTQSEAPQVNNVLPNEDIETIYQEYIKSFKKGAYNLIREESDPISGNIVPRKYFAGGLQLKVKLDYAMQVPQEPVKAKLVSVDINPDQAMTSEDFNKGFKKAALSPVGLVMKGVVVDQELNRDIMTTGLKLRNLQEFPIHGHHSSANSHDDRVVLSLTQDHVFENTALDDERSSPRYNKDAVVFIIDPDYIKANVDKFKFVGSSFSGRHRFYKEGLSKLGRGEITQNSDSALELGYGKVYHDEVHAIENFIIPPEAIMGIVVHPDKYDEIIKWNKDLGKDGLKVFIVNPTDPTAQNHLYESIYANLKVEDLSTLSMKQQMKILIGLLLNDSDIEHYINGYRKGMNDYKIAPQDFQSLDSKIEMLEPFLENFLMVQLSKYGYQSVDVFLRKMIEGGDVREFLENSNYALIPRVNSSNMPRGYIIRHLVEGYLVERILQISATKQPNKLTVILGGTQLSEIKKVVDIVHEALKTVARIKGIEDVDQWVSQWQVDIRCYGVQLWDLMAFQGYINAEFPPLLKRWVKIEFLNLIDKDHWGRITQLHPDIVFTVCSLYISEYFEEFKDPGNDNVRKHYVKHIYESLASQGLFVIEFYNEPEDLKIEGFSPVGPPKVSKPGDLIYYLQTDPGEKEPIPFPDDIRTGMFFKGNKEQYPLTFLAGREDAALENQLAGAWKEYLNGNLNQSIIKILDIFDQVRRNHQQIRFNRDLILMILDQYLSVEGLNHQRVEELKSYLISNGKAMDDVDLAMQVKEGPLNQIKIIEEVRNEGQLSIPVDSKLVTGLDMLTFPKTSNQGNIVRVDMAMSLAPLSDDQQVARKFAQYILDQINGLTIKDNDQQQVQLSVDIENIKMGGKISGARSYPHVYIKADKQHLMNFIVRGNSIDQLWLFPQEGVEGRGITKRVLALLGNLMEPSSRLYGSIANSETRTFLKEHFEVKDNVIKEKSTGRQVTWQQALEMTLLGRLIARHMGLEFEQLNLKLNFNKVYFDEQALMRFIQTPGDQNATLEFHAIKPKTQKKDVHNQAMVAGSLFGRIVHGLDGQELAGLRLNKIDYQWFDEGVTFDLGDAKDNRIGQLIFERRFAAPRTVIIKDVRLNHNNRGHGFLTALVQRLAILMPEGSRLVLDKVVNRDTLASWVEAITAQEAFTSIKEDLNFSILQYIHDGMRTWKYQKREGDYLDVVMIDDDFAHGFIQALRQYQQYVSRHPTLGLLSLEQIAQRRGFGRVLVENGFSRNLTIEIINDHINIFANRAMAIDKAMSADSLMDPIQRNGTIQQVLLTDEGRIYSFYSLMPYQQRYAWTIGNDAEESRAYHDTASWSIYSTPLDVIDAYLDLKQTIIKRAKEAKLNGKRINILDWGCGDGKALNDLKQWLKEEGIDNVSLFGFANTYQPAWINIAGVTFFWGNQEELFALIEQSNPNLKLDIIYSYYGLVHLQGRAQQQEAHIIRLLDLLNPEGQIDMSDMHEFQPLPRSNKYQQVIISDFHRVIKKQQDPAMSAPGGIDFNALEQELSLEGESGIELSDQQFLNIQIDRLTPYIRGIEPLKSLPEFLGV